MSDRPLVLIVDDKPENLFTLNKLLEVLEVEVCQAQSGLEALDLSLTRDFCVAIVDIQMPEMDGYELVELLRSNKATATLPVIFVSAIYSDEYHHRKGYEAGAVDFLSKPFIPEILLSKVKIFIDLYQQRQALQQEIKQRQQAEVDLEAANQVLHRLNADKDKFFSIISHDLRSPISTLLDHTHLFKEGDQLSPTDLHRMAEQSYTSILTIQNLVETLMTWSSMQRMHLKYPFTEINLLDLVDKTVEGARRMAAQKNIELTYDVEDEIYVHADEMMLGAILRNLLANALKYTLSGDRVILSAHRTSKPAPGQDGKLNNLVAVSVADTGIGITPEGQAQLFKVNIPYSTPGTAQESGTGLGLIMCKEMVGYQGGQIWVESKPGRGTTVTFTVPLAAEFATYIP